MHSRSAKSTICTPFRLCYLISVQMDMGLGSAGPQTEKRRLKMSISMNRILDVVVSFAFIGLALTTAGATAVLGV